MDCTLLLKRHAKACELKQPLDRERAEASLHAWLAAIGAPKCNLHLVVDSAGAARAARVAGAAWDASYTSIIAIGAQSLGNHETAKKWMPLLEAFEAGVHLVWIGEQDVYYSAPPKQIIVDEQRRLHHDHAPAFVWLGDVKLYFWHGVLVPPKWITDKQSLTAADALGQTNVELRRAACEIVGWDAILKQLDARTIERDEDPTIGELVEVSLPEAGRERFLRVTCGTGRRFAIPVPPTMQTALQANAWTFGFDDATDFIKPGVRT